MDEDKAAGLNLYVLLTANSNLALVRGNGMRSIIQSGERTRFTDIGAETAAWELYDEIDMQQGPNGGYTTLENILNGLPQDGRARYNNYGKGVLFGETDAKARAHHELQHVQSADGYFFTDPFICGPSEGGGVPEVVKTDGCRVAANYGWIVDRTRYLDGLDGQRKPVGVRRGRLAVLGVGSAGWPRDRAAGDPRGGLAVDHRRRPGDHLLQPLLRRSVPGPARPARPLLRSSAGNGHERQRPDHPARPGSKCPLRCVLRRCEPQRQGDDEVPQRHLLRLRREPENRPSTATFFVRSGSQAVVEGEGRIIPITNGRFSDDFADGNAIHIYRIE